MTQARGSRRWSSSKYDEVLTTLQKIVEAHKQETEGNNAYSEIKTQPEGWSVSFQIVLH